MEWVLIILFIGFNNAAATTARFDTHEACEAAGKSVAQVWGTRYTCAATK